MSPKKQNPYPLKDFRGVHPEFLARLEAIGIKKTHQMLIARTGFDGIAPLPKEVSSTIANARDLPKIVTW
jgi:hypothetical protein